MNRSPVSSDPDELIYTVTELTRRIKRLLEPSFAAVWVEGELSNLRRHTSGHVYFTLKDERASLRGVMFRTKAVRLRFDPEDGQKVRVFGSLNVYEPQGSYQIQAVKMEPLGVGELELAFRQTFQRLEREGLFDPSARKPLPIHPRVIGIVTSETGAAIRDLFSVIGRRAPHVRLVVRPARVQGVGAAEDVARAIGELDSWGGADVLIVGRGGGSLEDLWAFNEEVVARAIHAAETPVISAVGHEIDQTIADFAADVRAATPSAAAELAVPERAALLAGLGELEAGLGAGVARFLASKRERVEQLSRSPAFRSPLEFYRRRSQDVDSLVERRDRAMERLRERHRLLLERVDGKLRALSPLAILERGYAIVTGPGGEIVREAERVAEGESVDVRLGRGHLACTVDRIVGEAPGKGAATAGKEPS